MQDRKENQFRNPALSLASQKCISSHLDFFSSVNERAVSSARVLTWDNGEMKNEFVRIAVFLTCMFSAALLISRHPSSAAPKDGGGFDGEDDGGSSSLERVLTELDPETLVSMLGIDTAFQGNDKRGQVRGKMKLEHSSCSNPYLGTQGIRVMTPPPALKIRGVRAQLCVNLLL